MKIIQLFRNLKTRAKVLRGIELHERLLKQVRIDMQKHISKPDLYAHYWAIEKDYQRNLNILRELL